MLEHVLAGIRVFMKISLLFFNLSVAVMGSIVVLSPALYAQNGFLTPEEIKCFYQQGYVLKKGCLSADEVAVLRTQVTEVIERALEQAPNPFDKNNPFVFIEGTRVVFTARANGTISIGRINGVGGIKPELLATIRSEQMLHTFCALLGTQELEHIIAQLHPKLPGDGVDFPRHQDIQYRKEFDENWCDVLGNGSYAICIIPIDPMTAENGGLWIDSNNYPEDRGEPEARVWVNAEPGDLLFMHPCVFHGSGPNNSQISRRTLLTGYCAYGANHKQYPGAAVNTHITQQSDGSFVLQPAPWSQVHNNQEGHH